MNIRKELDMLPPFIYSFENKGRACYAILGGQSSLKINQVDNFRELLQLNDYMQRIYDKDILDESDKITLAKTMKKILNWCPGKLEHMYSIDQQMAYMETLDAEAVEEIVKQIQMYKAAREYYRQYVY